MDLTFHARTHSPTHTHSHTYTHIHAYVLQGTEGCKNAAEARRQEEAETHEAAGPKVPPYEAETRRAAATEAAVTKGEAEAAAAAAAAAEARNKAEEAGRHKLTAELRDGQRAAEVEEAKKKQVCGYMHLLADLMRPNAPSGSANAA